MPTLLEQLQAAGIQPANPPQGLPSAGQPAPLQAAPASSLVQQLQASGMKPENPPQITTETPKEPGFWQGVAQSVASPFLTTYTGAANVYDSLKDVKDGNYAAADETAKQERDFGWWGKATPVGASLPASKAEQEKNGIVAPFVKETKKMVGTGAQIAPYFMGGGFAPKGAGALSAMNAAGKTGAVIGGMSGGGGALAKDKGFFDTAVDTATGAAGGYVSGSALEGVKQVAKGMFPITTGVNKEVYKRAYADPQPIMDAKEAIKNAPGKEFQQLAESTAAALKETKQTVQAGFKKAADEFAANNPGVTFDVGGKAADIIEPLKQFGVVLKPVSDSTGNTVSYALVQDGPKTFTSGQMSKLNAFFQELNASKALTPDQVVRFSQAFDRLYNEVPYGNTGPLPFHAAMMQMRNKADQVLQSVLPDQMQLASADYAAFHKMMDEFGDKILDPNGNVKVGAETFLSNMLNSNKGVLQKGIPSSVLNAGQAIKDAKVLNQVVPQTGNRTVDIFRNVLISKVLPAATGVGAVTSGLGSLPLGAAIFGASSPAIVGNMVMGASKLAPLWKPVTNAMGAGLISGFAQPVANYAGGLLTSARKKILGK